MLLLPFLFTEQSQYIYISVTDIAIKGNLWYNGLWYLNSMEVFYGFFY